MTLLLAWLRAVSGQLQGGYSMCVVPLPLSLAVDDMGLFDSLSLLTTSADVRAAVPIALHEPGSAGLAGPDVPEDAGWEDRFAWGVFYSQEFVKLEEHAGVTWSADAFGSGAGAPDYMLRAEELLRAAEDAPADHLKKKLAERSLRLYYHAKWLAERNYARAAEFRYRAAADLAKRARRSVLASHALSRLGYFLVQWSRHEEAAAALDEAHRLNGRTNPLAVYLDSVLKRKSAGADVSAIMKAEEHILAAAKLPSEELEFERALLAEEIAYWRGAEASPRHCLKTAHAAHALICLCAHGGLAVREAVTSMR